MCGCEQISFGAAAADKSSDSHSRKVSDKRRDLYSGHRGRLSVGGTRDAHTKKGQ